MNLSKKTNIMPPMEYRVYEGKTYLIDPKSPLTIGDFVTFLQAKSVSDIAPVARKLKLVTEYVSKNELRANIIKILQALNIAEPIEIPHKMKINIGKNLNSTPVNANLPANLPVNAPPANANLPANLSANTPVNSNANRTNSNTPLNLGGSGNGLVLGGQGESSSPLLNLNKPKPSKLSLNGTNSGGNSGGSINLNARPSNVKVLSESFGEPEGPPLELGNPKPSGVQLSEYTNGVSQPPLNLSARSNMTLKQNTNTNTGSLRLSAKPSTSVSLPSSLSGNRNSHITSVVKQEVSNNSSVTNALANLQKKLTG